MRKTFLIVLLVLTCMAANAQKVAVGTNVVEWANFGTANIEAGLSIGQHFSVFVGGRYNPWSFHNERHDLPFYWNTKDACIGIRYWPWYIFSGWWVGMKAQYQQFMQGGLWRPILEKGTGIGAGLSGGYTLMLHKNLNIEFGIGLWGGRYLDYSKYQCTDCLDLITTGPRNFIQFDDLMISLVYVF